MTSPVAPKIRDLYSKLKRLGIDRKYVQSAILPDWWDDSLYANESNRLTAQLGVSRFLGISLRDLAGPLDAFASQQNARLKRARNADLDEVAGAVAAAMHAARLVASLMAEHLPFTGVRPALDIRQQLLARPECMAPDLTHLVDFCWRHGIGVVHLTSLPKGSKKIAGLATFVGTRPVVVLCSGRDSPAWLAFHLAHELGHIMCAHVRSGDQPLVDVEIGNVDDERQEQEADSYAIQLLTGHPELQLQSARRLSGMQLASLASDFGRAHRIDPGTVALVYGYCNRLIPVAQTALKAMNLESGGREILADAFRRHLSVEDLPDSAHRHLSAVTQVLGLSESH
jgi:hypothetical protein